MLGWLISHGRPLWLHPTGPCPTMALLGLRVGEPVLFGLACFE